MAFLTTMLTNQGGMPRQKRLKDSADHWLSLAAMPVFAIMALATGVGGAPDMAMPSPLGGMAAMYGLMSVFHSPPWLKLISNRRNPPHQPKERNA